MDERKLAARIVMGDMHAFDELVAAYQNKVIHISYSMLSDYEDACDASQEVFVKVYRSIANFRGESSLSTWIYRITKNVCMDFMRKRKEKALSIDDEKEDAPKLEIEDETKSPEYLAEKNETVLMVRQAIDMLEENQKVILTMYDIEGMSYDEISETLEIPAGTVKSRLNRARQKLRKILSEKREHFI